jgi:ribosomal protein S18 acetylase RimI-like enzyme
MLDAWFRTIEANVTIDEFHRLPKHAAYKHEYYGGRYVLTPRPKAYHAMLDLPAFAAPPGAPAGRAAFEPMTFRVVEDSDWEALPPLLAAAFHRVPPFATLGDEEAVTAARDCLEHTRTGGDGPLALPACIVATDEDARPVGALLVTLWPDRPLDDWHAAKWPEPPPADAAERGLGRPHLTWAFVSPWHAGHGVGTAMLAETVGRLRASGYRELVTTFISGNDSSMLWHWRNGFRLLEYVGSYRRMDRETRKLRTERAADGSVPPPATSDDGSPVT